MRQFPWPRISERKITPGLQGMFVAFDIFPEILPSLPPVIHIAGTNGKGSTTAFIHSILNASGYSAHRYSSPHLVHANERIILRDEQIRNEALTSVLRECEDNLSGVEISFFKGVTVAALLAFSRTWADFALLEVGLGGRLDATNFFSHPDARPPICSVITAIGMDHMDVLGDDIHQIARDKAGIMQSGVPCVIAPQYDAAVYDVMADEATRHGTQLIMHGQDWKLDGSTVHLAGQSFTIPTPSLMGEHQYSNAATAVIAAYYALQQRGAHLSQEAVDRGVSSAKHIGRLQEIRMNAAPSGHRYFLDGGHNEMAGKALADIIRRWRDEGRAVYVIMGMREGKDARAFLGQMAPYISYLVACGWDEGGQVGVLPPAQLVDIATALGIKACKQADIYHAISYISDMYPQEDAYVLCTGSLHFIGEILAEPGKKL